MVVVVESIFNKSTWDLFHAMKSTVVQMFVVFVIGIAGTYRIGVMVVEEIGVEQQVAIIGKLVGVVVGEAVIGVHLVVGHLVLHSEAGVFAIEVVATLGKSLVAFGIDADAV